MKAQAQKSEKNRSLRAGKTLQRLKDAALDAFSEKSFDTVTIEEITKKADVAKGTLYQHFDDKEEVVITLLEEAVEHLIGYIRNYESAPKNLEQAIEHIFNAHCDFVEDSREEFLLLFQGKLLLKLQNEYSDDFKKPYIKYLEEIANQLSTYSVNIDRLKTSTAACSIAGFVFGFFSFAMISMTQNQVDKSIKQLSPVFVKTIREFMN